MNLSTTAENVTTLPCKMDSQSGLGITARWLFHQGQCKAAITHRTMSSDVVRHLPQKLNWFNINVNLTHSCASNWRMTSSDIMSCGKSLWILISCPALTLLLIWYQRRILLLSTIHIVHPVTPSSTTAPSSHSFTLSSSVSVPLPKISINAAAARTTSVKSSSEILPVFMRIIWIPFVVRCRPISDDIDVRRRCPTQWRTTSDDVVLCVNAA